MRLSQDVGEGDGQSKARNSAALLVSEKDGREHRIVLEEILAAIAPHARELQAPKAPRILSLAEVLHLWSPIRAQLRQGAGLGELVGDLHPTPAVGGLAALSGDGPDPLARAGPRGWYAGLVGWIGPDQADFAVAIRSGIVRGNRMTAFGGAGISPRFDPLAEWDETARKAASFINLFAEPHDPCRWRRCPSNRHSGPAATARVNLIGARALAEGLVAGGVRHVCLSPGSRSSPLALAVHFDARLAISVQFDERSAAFLALGLAKSTRSPVALVCTSGTAAADLLRRGGAFSRALAGGADRGPAAGASRHGCAADHRPDGLYGSHVRLFRDLPCPDEPGWDAGHGRSGSARRAGRRVDKSLGTGASQPA